MVLMKNCDHLLFWRFINSTVQCNWASRQKRGYSVVEVWEISGTYAKHYRRELSVCEKWLMLQKNSIVRNWWKKVLIACLPARNMGSFGWNWWWWWRWWWYPGDDDEQMYTNKEIKTMTTVCILRWNKKPLFWQSDLKIDKGHLLIGQLLALVMELGYI